MGDFYISLIDSNSSASVDFVSNMLAARSLPTASIPSRVTNITDSLIDNIFSTLSLKENLILVSDISDHFTIYSLFSFKQGKNNWAQVFDYYSIWLGDKELFLLGSKLAENSWSFFDNDKDFSCLFDSFYGTVKGFLAFVKYHLLIIGLKRLFL